MLHGEQFPFLSRGRFLSVGADVAVAVRTQGFCESTRSWCRHHEGPCSIRSCC